MGGTLKKGGSRLNLFLILVILTVLVGVITTSGLNNTSADDVTTKIPLANVVNNVSIQTPYIKQYLATYNDFSDVMYEKVLPNSVTHEVLTVGNHEDNIKGFEINGKRYAVHLLLCDYNLQRCFFRINGVPTGALHAFKEGQPEDSAAFNLDATYKIKINSITFDHCDNRRFCNLHYEAYDIVNISVMPR